MDLAYNVQNRLETIVEEMVRYWTQKTSVYKLAIGGGVGLNVKMNGKLFRSGIIKDIFVHPLCADTGTSIGAALAYQHLKKPIKQGLLKNIYYGPSYNNDEIVKILKLCQLSYTKEEFIEKEAAKLLAEGKIVAWFQGKMEFGPRALGS